MCKGKKHFLVIFFAISILLPTVLAILYSLPGADDFSFAMQIKSLQADENFFMAVFHNLYIMYFSWQGTFTTNFLVSMFHPFDMWGIWGIRICLIVCFAFFIGCFFKFEKILFKIYFKDSDIVVLIICVIGEALILNNYSGTEIFFWFTGACAYLVPLSFALLAAAYYIQGISNDNMKSYILSALFGLIGAGGSLQVTAAECWIFLVVCFSKKFDKRQMKKKRVFFIIPFLFSLFGALLNTTAPGNFVRKSSSGEHLYIRSAMINSIYAILHETENLFEKYPVGIFLLIAFVIVLLQKNEKEKVSLKRVILSAFFAVFTAYISTFPVLLGYNADSLSSPRTEYICDFILVIAYLYITCIFGEYLKTVHHLTISKDITLSVIIVAFMFLSICGYKDFFTRISNGMSVKIIDEIRLGTLQENSKTYMMIYSTLEETENDEIELKIKRPKETVIYVPKINDSQWWVNQTLAKYYGIESINVEWIDE